ncbi:hypothetical protein FKM82_010022 [Ascaphus truei]
MFPSESVYNTHLTLHSNTDPVIFTGCSSQLYLHPTICKDASLQRPLLLALLLGIIPSSHWWNRPNMRLKKIRCWRPRERRMSREIAWRDWQGSWKMFDLFSDGRCGRVI